MRLKALDGIRGLLALFVVMYHIPESMLPESPIMEVFKSGYIFVDFFFVLSGFVISLNYEGRIIRGQHLISFMKRRFLRLYPLLLYSSSVYFVIELITTVYFPHYQGQVDSTKFLAVKFLDTLFLTNSICIFSCDTGINYPSWSISAEFISYLVFGIIVLKKALYELRYVLLILCIIFFVASGNYAYDGDYGYLRGIFSFMLGSLTYTYHSYLGRLFSVNYSKIIILCAFIGTYFLLSAYSNTVKLVSSIFFPLISSLLIVIIINSKSLSRVFEARALLSLGDLSYSVYLNHLLIIVLFKKIPDLFDFVVVNRSLYLFLFMVVLIGYSKFTRNYIEGIFYRGK